MGEKRSPRNFLKSDLYYRPLPFFILFFLSLSFLNFRNLPVAGDLFVLFLGILLPFGLRFFLTDPPTEIAAGEPPIFKKEWFHFTVWLWLPFVLLFALTRFYFRDDFWPWSDDGIYAFFAESVRTQGEWHVLYGGSKLEPLPAWILAGWFALFKPSLGSLRVYPVFIYSAILGLGYGAARQFFPRSICFVAVWFLAFNFIPQLISIHNEPYEILLLLECFCLYYLGTFLNQRSEKKNGYFWLLAVGVGLGFYSYPAWPVVAVMVGLPVLYTEARSASQRFLVGWVLLVLALVSPLFLARFSPGGLCYVQSLWGKTSFLNYLGALFWNGFKGDPGNLLVLGYWDPCFGALVLTGLLESWRYRSSKWVQWVWAASFLFLLPGALTNHVEIGRITALLPVSVLMALWGLEGMGRIFPSQSRGKTVLISGLVLLSTGFYLVRLWGPEEKADQTAYGLNKAHWISMDYAKAYHVLKKESETEPCFLVFENLNNATRDQTLNILSFPFDATRNPRWKGRPAREAALLVNCNYEPFLRKMFPDSKWTWLSPGLPADYGGLLLGFIPVNPATEKQLDRFGKAEEVLRENDVLRMKLFLSPQQAAPILLRDLDAHFSVFQADPFLESVFWERKAFYQEYGLNLPEAIRALEKAQATGLDAAQIYNKWGVLAAVRGRKQEAQKCFERALRCPVNRTTAQDNLQRLSGMKEGEIFVLSGS
jgi:hypothetical protein